MSASFLLARDLIALDPHDLSSRVQEALGPLFVHLRIAYSLLTRRSVEKAARSEITKLGLWGRASTASTASTASIVWRNVKTHVNYSCYSISRKVDNELIVSYPGTFLRCFVASFLTAILSREFHPLMDCHRSSLSLSLSLFARLPERSTDTFLDSSLMNQGRSRGHVHARNDHARKRPVGFTATMVTVDNVPSAWSGSFTRRVS
jgi:hypothetical protein